MCFYSETVSVNILRWPKWGRHLLFFYVISGLHQIRIGQSNVFLRLFYGARLEYMLKYHYENRSQRQKCQCWFGFLTLEFTCKSCTSTIPEGVCKTCVQTFIIFRTLSTVAWTRTCYMSCTLRLLNAHFSFMCPHNVFLYSVQKM